MSDVSDELKELLLKIVPDRVSFENSFYKVIVGPNLYFFIRESATSSSRTKTFDVVVGDASGKRWIYNEFSLKDMQDIYEAVVNAQAIAAHNHIDRNLPSQHQAERSFYAP